MNMTADRPPRRMASEPPSQRLRQSFAAARISFTWLGVRKSLSSDQKQLAADHFGAQGQFLSAGKKLLDTRHPRFRAVTAVRGQVGAYWKSLSLPYPEPGLRLIRQKDIQSFGQQMQLFKERLAEAVGELDEHYADLKEAARDRLGSLFDPLDYPASLQGLFEVSWEFPSVEPPQYLLQLSPELYQQEQQRMTARFDEAVRLAEEAFTTEFASLVNHLVERLSPGVDGQAKVFRDSAVDHLGEFFERFKKLNVGSSSELEQLIQTAQQAVKGAAPQAVRNSSTLRQQITQQLSSVSASLDQLLIDQPRRRLLRPQQGGTA
jgi:hypothetical protein